MTPLQLALWASAVVLLAGCADVPCLPHERKVGTVCLPVDASTAVAADSGATHYDAAAVSEARTDSGPSLATDWNEGGVLDGDGGEHVPPTSDTGASVQGPDASSDSSSPSLSDASTAEPVAAGDAGDAGMGSLPDAAEGTVILDLSHNQPPSSIPTGAWPVQMRSGRWRFTWTPNFPSSNLSDGGDGFIVLFQFGGTGDTADQIWLEKQGTVCKAWISYSSSVWLSIASLTFAAGQPITYELDLPNGKWVVTGASAGNGTVTHSGPLSWPDGNLFVGRAGQSGLAEFDGLISNVEGLSASN